MELWKDRIVTLGAVQSARSAAKMGVMSQPSRDPGPRRRAPRYRIPSELHEVFISLAHQPELKFATAMRSLNGPPPLSVADAREHFTDALDGNIGPPSRVFGALLGLALVFLNSGQDPRSFSRQIIENSALKLTSADSSKLRSRLRTLVSSEALCTLARARERSTDDENTTHESTILTDVRPIGHEANVNAVILCHRLRITYHGSDGLSEFQVGISATELARLNEQIAHALSERDTLQRRLQDAGLTTVYVDADEA